jgi:hypothetical protein
MEKLLPLPSPRAEFTKTEPESRATTFAELSLRGLRGLETHWADEAADLRLQAAQNAQLAQVIAEAEVYRAERMIVTNRTLVKSAVWGVGAFFVGALLTWGVVAAMKSNEGGKKHEPDDIRASRTATR